MPEVTKQVVIEFSGRDLIKAVADDANDTLTHLEINARGIAMQFQMADYSFNELNRLLFNNSAIGREITGAFQGIGATLRIITLIENLAKMIGVPSVAEGANAIGHVVVGALSGPYGAAFLTAAIAGGGVAAAWAAGVLPFPGAKTTGAGPSTALPTGPAPATLSTLPQQGYILRNGEYGFWWETVMGVSWIPASSGLIPVGPAGPPGTYFGYKKSMESGGLSRKQGSTLFIQASTLYLLLCRQAAGM